MKTSANIEAVRKLCERWAWLSEKEPSAERKHLSLRRMVPDHNIRVLNDCGDAAGHSLNDYDHSGGLCPRHRR